MKIKSTLFAVFALVGLPFAAQAIELDAPAANFTLPSASGKQINLTDYADKTVVLEWTNHQCPYVQKHYSSDNMQALQRQYTAQGVVWLSIISSAPGKQGYIDAAQAKQLTTSRNAAPSEVLFDASGSVGKLYGAKTTPHIFIIDKGQLRYAGAIDSIKSANPADIAKATNYLDAGLKALLAGQPIQHKTSIPYGCSVKYAS